MAIRFVCPRCKGTDLFVELRAAQAYIAGGEWDAGAIMECGRCWYRAPLADFDTEHGAPPGDSSQAGMPAVGRRFNR